MGSLKYVGAAVWCLGIAACIAFALWSGLGDVGNAIGRVGWGMLGVVVARTVLVSIHGAGWWLLFPAGRVLPLHTAILLRFVREGVNALLPLTQLGGEIIGARLATFFAVPGPLSAATIIVDILMQAGTQFLFAAVGILTLTALDTDRTVAVTAAAGLAVAAPLLGTFYFAQRRFGHRFLQTVLGRVSSDGKWRFLGTVDAVYHDLSAIYARRKALARGGLVHMAAWFVGVAEVLIVLACTGTPATLLQAVVIESLVQAVRGAAFAVPSAFGAQEAGLILLCGLFQIPSDQALALSFIKRAADLVTGIPGLIALQVIEGSRFTADRLRGAAQPQVPVKSASAPGECRPSRAAASGAHVRDQTFASMR